MREKKPGKFTKTVMDLGKSKLRAVLMLVVGLCLVGYYLPTEVRYRISNRTGLLHMTITYCGLVIVDTHKETDLSRWISEQELDFTGAELWYGHGGFIRQFFGQKRGIRPKKQANDVAKVLNAIHGHPQGKEMLTEYYRLLDQRTLATKNFAVAVPTANLSKSKQFAAQRAVHHAKIKYETFVHSILSGKTPTVQKG